MTEIMQRLLDGESLDATAAEALMRRVMEGGVGDARLGATLATLELRGVTAAELSGFARAMRACAIRVQPRDPGQAIDTCGTGGGGGGFNVSTAAAFVAVAAGATVAKHGNRAATSACGSADVLEALGVDLALEPAAIETLLDELGIAFLFAPRHHPAMRRAVGVRRALGVRTVFNLLGPLTNPAGVRRQLLGVYSPAVLGRMADALAGLGTIRAWVVHGDDGQDELSLGGTTRVAELRDGTVFHRTVEPEDAGLERAPRATLGGGNAATNARLLRETLAGRPGPRTDAVLLNAAGALVVAGRAADLLEGVALGRDAVGSGRATRLLAEFVAASRDLAARTPAKESR